MAFGITDLKKGAVFKLDGTPYRVLEYGQKVMGRGGSIVNVRIKSLIDGKVLEKTFKGNEAVEPADVAYQNVQYLYNDSAKFYFMDNDTYEQIEVSADLVGDYAGYLKEGDIVKAQTFEGQVINIELPKNVYLEVTYTETVVKGDTTSSVLKDATVETGITVKVPAFIKQGDIISVDTETGAYRERKKGLTNMRFPTTIELLANIRAPQEVQELWGGLKVSVLSRFTISQVVVSDIEESVRQNAELYDHLELQKEGVPKEVFDGLDGAYFEQGINSHGLNQLEYDTRRFLKKIGCDIIWHIRNRFNDYRPHPIFHESQLAWLLEQEYLEVEELTLTKQALSRNSRGREPEKIATVIPFTRGQKDAKTAAR